MNKSKHWWGLFSEKRPQACNHPATLKHFYSAIMMENLEKSFSSKNFEAFTEIVANLTEEAAKQNYQATQLLVYLKRQVNFGYQGISCELGKLSGSRSFTPEDFEKLVNIHENQQIARKEEHLLIK